MFRSVLLASAAAIAACPAAAQTAPPATIELEEISVTANLTPTPTAAVGSAVTIITREELEKKQIRVLSDALRSVPGVSVNRTGNIGGQTQVRIRGSEGNHTLVLIDGVEVNNPATESEFYFNNLLALDVERIEVLRGPQSALYGSDAIGGVVNIVTRRGEGKPKAAAFVEGGTRGTAAAGASLSGATDRVDYFFSASGLRTDGFSAASEWRGNDEKDGYRNGSAFAKLGFQALDNLRFDFVGRATDYFAEGDPETFGVGAEDGVFDLEGREFFGRAQASLDLLDGRWQQKFGVGTNHNEYVNAASWGPADFIGDKLKFDYQSSYFHQPDSLPGAKQTFTFAAEHEINEATTESSFSSFERSMKQTGFIGQYQLDLWDHLFVTASIRHDINDVFDDSTTYRLTGAYLIEPTGSKLRASWGTGVKNPTLFELYGSSPTYQGNSDLKPESAKGWDIGLDQSFLGGRLLMDVTYFDQRITDLITGSGQTSINLPGTSTIHGIELGLSARPLDGLTLRAAYTWLEGKDAQGIELTRRPSHAASVSMNYAFIDDRANLGIEVAYNGTRTDLPWWRPIVELDDYVLVHLRGAYKIDDNTEFYARVENLFDEEYEEVYTFGGTGRLAVIGVRGTF